MQNITLLDYFLVIPYIAFFYLLAKLKMKKTEPELQPILMRAFWLRIFGSFVYCLVVQYYYGYGDSFTYFKGSNIFTSEISNNLGSVKYLFAPNSVITTWYNASGFNDADFAGYFLNPAGNMVMKISAMVSYISFNRFLIISLFFGYFSFLGQWKLFLVFDEINKQKNRKLLALATLYSPSIWFWGSGLLKDSVCLGAIGFMVFILYKFLVKKKFSLGELFALVFLLFIVNIIKSYISAVFVASTILTILLVYLQKIKNIVAKIFLAGFLLVIALLVLIQLDIGSQITAIIEDSVIQINGFHDAYQSGNSEDDNSKAGFTMDELDPSIGSLALKAPVAIFTCLYRPFLWESRKVMILFTSVESTLLLWCTLYLIVKVKFFKFFGAIFNSPYLFYSFTLSFLFALIIGFTTLNFGTMIRYKIILLPFFYFFLVHMYSFYYTRKEIIQVN